MESAVSARSARVPGRKLEDKIRELCARAAYEEGHCWDATLGELQVASKANTTAAATVIGRPDVVRERRRA